MTIQEAQKICDNYTGGSLDLEGLTSAEGLVLPSSVDESLSLSSLTSAEGLVLPEKIGGWLALNGLTSAEKESLKKENFYLKIV